MPFKIISEGVFFEQVALNKWLEKAIYFRSALYGLKALGMSPIIK